MLLCSFKTSNLVKWPISGGISLWSVLFCRLRILKKLKFPTYGDIEPTSSRDRKFYTVTLWCWRPHVTPCHWQKWMLSFQELITLRGSWIILALNSSNAKRSVSLCPLTTEVTNMPRHQRRIKACMEKDEDGAALSCKSPMHYGWRNFV